MRDIDEMEREIIRMIEEVQERYRQEIAPLVNHLANLRALQPAPPILVSLETLMQIEAAQRKTPFLPGQYDI